MALLKDFHRSLDEMWRRYSAGIRSMVRSRRGRKPAFSRKWRNKRIMRLLTLVERILCKQGAREELRKTTQGRRWRQIKGWGQGARFECVRSWAERNIDGAFVYSFWKGRKRCLYVGKAKSWRRLCVYKKSIYLWHATRLRIDRVKRRSELGKAECLAIHLFRPKDNAKKAPHNKWGKACPVCIVHDRIHSALRDLFRIK